MKFVRFDDLREWRENYIRSGKAKSYDDMTALLVFINSALSIDIVFCHECKWENTQKCPPHRMGLIHDESDYCSYGIRKGADDEID